MWYVRFHRIFNYKQYEKEKIRIFKKIQKNGNKLVLVIEVDSYNNQKKEANNMRRTIKNNILSKHNIP